MAINLHEKYAKELATVFTTNSILASRLSSEYEFTGFRTVKVMTPITIPMTDYTRSGISRYGTPTEMQDIIQELTMSQDKSFALTVDKGNNADQQGLKAAGKMVSLQMKERMIPEAEKYAFNKIAHEGGIIVGNAAAIAKTNVVERIAEGTVALDNAEVPQEGRTLFVPAEVYKHLRLSDQFLNIDALGSKALSKGKVGEFDGMDVVKVPSGRWPANVNFMIIYKGSALFPFKLHETKIHEDPPGISGNLMEGRDYYDAFVLGSKADGIYIDVDTGSGKGTVLGALTINAATGAITGAASGATVKFTVDGSDPRYSDSAQIGTDAGTGEGVVVKAYQFKAASFPSKVSAATLTA